MVSSKALQSPLVSVCILAYNHEKYIFKAIASVLGQSYSNVEIIIVDNGSTDKTVDIIEREFFNELNDGSIQFYKLKGNTFPSHGTNYGIKKSNGDYICLLSGDDSFDLNKIQRQLDFMLKNDSSNLFTWVNVIDEFDNPIESSFIENLFNKPYSSQNIKEHFLKEGNMLCALSAMFKRHIFENYGYFDERLIQLQDFDLWLKLISREEINLLPERLVNYRIRGDEKNLSLLTSSERIYRTEFEEVFVYRNLLKFDVDTICSVTGFHCNEDNKIEALIKYFIEKEELNRAKALMFVLFEALGSRVDFPSEKYDFFYNEYSKLDVFNSMELNDCYSEISRLKLIESSRGWKFIKVLKKLLGR